MKLIEIDGMFLNEDRIDGIVTNYKEGNPHGTHIYCGGSETPFYTQFPVKKVIEKIRGYQIATPQESKCKDCKWWKDSDGEYRRGCGAESICPINTDKVYQGEGYCYLYEPNTSER